MKPSDYTHSAKGRTMTDRDIEDRAADVIRAALHKWTRAALDLAALRQLASSHDMREMAKQAETAQKDAWLTIRPALRQLIEDARKDTP
jgi:maltoporin